MLSQIAKAERRRLARRVAKNDDRSLCVDMSDCGGEGGPASGFEDQREVSLHFVDPLDDLARAAQVAAARGSADHGSDARPGPRGDLSREMPDAAGSAGNKYTLGEQRRAMTQCPQRRQAGDRQG